MPIVDAPNLNHLWARLLVEELLRQGAGHFVLSPGSRSTSLAVAVADNPRAAHTIHFDERAAGFFALGHAQASGKASVLICTSGSAVANYWPAVVEASASRTPLILLTSDRPPELLACGANQAIDQNRIFGDYTRDFVNLPTPTAEIGAEYLLTTVARCMRAALGAPAGPVQINCMYREPLAPVGPPDFGDTYMSNIAEWINSGEPYTTWSLPARSLASTACESVAARAASAKRPLLLVGRLVDPSAQAAVADLAAHLGWPVFPDVCSGLRLKHSTPNVVPWHDLLLLSDAACEKFRPDFVLHAGGAMTSKRLNQYLERVRPDYVHLADHPLRRDPGHQVGLRLEADVHAACAQLKAVLRAQGTSRATRLRGAAESGHRAVIDLLAKNDDLSEIGVAIAVSRARPENGVLFLGNSMPVRDMDTFGAADGAGGITAANRGASGIDGNVATAAGYARATGQPAIAVLGDLTALHDLNALALLRDIETPFVLVVVNNDGGGIFSFLPIAKHGDVFDEFFGTPHGLSFGQAAAMFGLRYVAPGTMSQLTDTVRAALNTRGPTLVEVRTTRASNHELHVEAKDAATLAIDTTLAADR